MAPAGPATVAAGVHRQRAGSYDERRNNRVKFAPAVVAGDQYTANDNLGGERSVSSVLVRRRSASLGCNNDGNPAALTSARGCDTIAEDGAEEERIIFPVN